MIFNKYKTNILKLIIKRDVQGHGKGRRLGTELVTKKLINLTINKYYNVINN